MKHCGCFLNIFSLSLTYKLFLLLICFISIISHISFTNINETCRMLGYFTVLSNFFCFAMTFFSVFKIVKNKSRKFNYNALIEYTKVFTFFKGMCLMSIILTFGIFHFMVANYEYPLLYNNVLHLPIKDLFAHYLVPLFYTLDWLLFQPKDLNDIRVPFLWAIYPFIYIMITFGRLHLLSKNSVLYLEKCPYFFIDIDKLGGERVAIFSIIMLFVILSIGYLIIAIEKIMIKIKTLLSR